MELFDDIWLVLCSPYVEGLAVLGRLLFLPAIVLVTEMTNRDDPNAALEDAG